MWSDKFFAKIAAFLLIGLVFSLGSAGAAIDQSGPHGGSVLKNKDDAYEVKVEPKQHRVEVFTLHSEETPPSKMSVTIFRDSGTGQTIELKAINPTEKFPRYEGELGLNAGSIIGFELQFGFGGGSLEVLKSMPRLPEPSGRK